MSYRKLFLVKAQSQRSYNFHFLVYVVRILAFKMNSPSCAAMISANSTIDFRMMSSGLKKFGLPNNDTLQTLSSSSCNK